MLKFYWKVIILWMLISFFILTTFMGYKYKNRSLEVNLEWRRVYEVNKNSSKMERNMNSFTSAEFHSDLEFQELMNERKKTIEDFCTKQKLESKWSLISKETLRKDLGKIYQMKERNVAWCAILKSSSSTWRNFLLEISPQFNEDEKIKLKEKYRSRHDQLIHLITKPLTKKDEWNYFNQNVDDMRSFLVARHPFQRLVASFRDKIERLHESDNVEEDYFYKIHGAKIVNKFRDQAKEKFGPDFLSPENNLGAVIPVSGRRSPKQPTFWEFVQYVKGQVARKMDDHWRPIFSLCSVCQVKYNYIVHVENSNYENKLMKQVLEPNSEPEETWDNKYNSKDEALTPEKITQIYFSTLDKSDVYALYKLYEPDFIMFGYEFKFGNVTLP